MLQLDPCTWHACIDPPLPSGLGLRHLWDGENPVEFGDTVKYKCARDNLWFEHNRDFESFELKCLNDGSFEDEDKPDDEWLNCVPSKLSHVPCPVQ